MTTDLNALSDLDVVYFNLGLSLSDCIKHNDFAPNTDTVRTYVMRFREEILTRGESCYYRICFALGLSLQDIREYYKSSGKKPV